MDLRVDVGHILCVICLDRNNTKFAKLTNHIQTITIHFQGDTLTKA